MRLGKIIEAFRKERGMTLCELSRKSGVAIATLSRMENDRMTGTLRSHIKIAEAFEIPLIDLYKELPFSKKIVEMNKKDARNAVSMHNKESASILLVSNARDKKILPLLVTIVKGGKTETETNSHGMEKFIYVLEGKVKAVIGDGNYELTAGDTMYLDSSAPHHFINSGDGEARLISASSR